MSADGRLRSFSFPNQDTTWQHGSLANCRYEIASSAEIRLFCSFVVVWLTVCVRSAPLTDKIAKGRQASRSRHAIQNDMRLRTYIVGSLWTGAILLIVAAAAGVLWWLLGELGDHAAAKGALGVTLVALVCWQINFVVLVVLVALATLKLVDRSSSGESETGALDHDRRLLQGLEQDEET